MDENLNSLQHHPKMWQSSKHKMNAAILVTSAAYRRSVGRLFRVTYLHGYIDDDNYELSCDAIVRVMPTSDDDLTHVNGDWVDPYWDVKLIAGDAPSHSLRSIWIAGPSLTIPTGEVQWEGVTPCGWLDVLCMMWRYRHV